jgi:hypothetical protein
MSILTMSAIIGGPLILLGVFGVYMAYRPEKKQDGETGITTE